MASKSADRRPISGARHLLLALLSILTQAAGVSGADDAAEQVLAGAVDDLLSYNFQQAYERFDDALQRVEPASALWQQAVFGKAVSAHQGMPPTRDRIDEAARLYTLLLDEAQGSRFAPRARMNLGRLHELRDYPGDVPDVETARSCYEQVLADWPDADIADEALLRLAGTFTQRFEDRGQIRHGVSMLEQWLDRRPDNHLAALMWLHLATTYFIRLDDEPAALDCYLRADAVGLPDSTPAGTLYWRMAAIAERLPGRLDVAIDCYRKIIRITPTSGRAYESQQALERIRADHPELQIDIPAIRLFHSNEAAP